MTRQVKILSNFLTLSSGEFLARILGFIATAYLARVLGTEGFGKISLSFAIAGYFLLAVTWGFDTYAIREISRNRSIVHTFVGNILGMRLLIAVLAYAALVLLVILVQLPADTELLLLIYGITLFTFPINVSWVFSAHENMKVAALNAIIIQMVYVLLVLSLVDGMPRIAIVPSAQVVSEAAALLITGILYIRFIGPIRPSFDLAAWKSIFIKSFPFGISRILRIIVLGTGLIMVGVMVGESEVGIYSAAYRIVLLLITISLFYHYSLFPTLSKSYKGNHDNIQSLVTSSTRFTLMLALPMGVGGTMISAPVIDIIFGSEYSSSATVFAILVWLASLLLLTGVFGHVLIVLNRQITVVKLLAWAFLLNIAFNLILITVFGLIGAAITAVLTELFLLVSTFLCIRREGMHIEILPYTIKPLISSAIMAIVIYFLPDLNVFFIMIAGALVYFSMLLILKAMTVAELQAIIQQIIKGQSPTRSIKGTPD